MKITGLSSRQYYKRHVNSFIAQKEYLIYSMKCYFSINILFRYYFFLVVWDKGSTLNINSLPYDNYDKLITQEIRIYCCKTYILI